MGTFDELLGSSEPQSDEFPPYTIGPDGRVRIIIYAKPRPPPPISDEDRSGALQGEAGVYGPSRAVDAEGRTMSDFKEAFLPTINELITRDTHAWEAMTRLRDADVNSGGYTTRDDEEGSALIGQFAVDGDRRRWPTISPSSSYSPPNRFGEGITDLAGSLRGPNVKNFRASSELVPNDITDTKRGPNIPYGPRSDSEGWPAGSFLNKAYGTPGGTAPFVRPLFRPLAAEPALPLIGNKDFGDSLEFPATVVPPLPPGQFQAPRSVLDPREPGPYRDVPPAWTDGGYMPSKSQLTDFGSRSRPPFRRDPIPLLRHEGVPRHHVPGVRPIEAPRLDEIRPNELVDDIQQRLLNEYGPREYGLRSLQNSPSERAVAVLRARGYRPRNKVLDFERVLALSEKEVRGYCEKLKEVQDLTYETTAHVRATKPNLSPQSFGTEVHKIIENIIKALNDPNFIAEISYLPGKPIRDEEKPSRDEEKPDRKGVKYGTKNSVRLDVMENIGDKTVCVYDVKTGRRGLSDLRMDVIARVVFKYFPDTERIVVTEVRPRPAP
jgi:hypothetical protein